MTRFYLVLAAALMVVVLLTTIGTALRDQVCIAGQQLTAEAHQVLPVDCSP